jgi:selenocysteine-specific elongation factor
VGAESDAGDHREPPLILGTAGHIDHGKTALIRALTGVETDRLPEEKDRGITIELGFAPLDLPSGRRFGVVDVPGHEGLVRTMVAGATGIDVVLLVIAADEGVMPQTREHLAICDLLGRRHGVVALTKIDVADPDVAELARAEAEELLATTALAGAPVLPVSSLTGDGLDTLRSALEAAATAAAAETVRRGPARLWVDRAFEMRGFGPVATGTLVGSPLRVGDAMAVHPTGRTARVRGLQSFGETAPMVQPGARCAVNLQGIELADLARGQQLAAEGTLAGTATFDARLLWLPESPPLPDEPTSVELLVGTTQFRARLAPIGAGGGLAGGARGLARIHLDDAEAALLPGDRFVVRGFARGTTGGTLGGGTVLDVAPPRRRRSDPALHAGLERLEDASPDTAVVTRVARTGFAGLDHGTLLRQTGLERRVLDATLEAEGRAGRVVRAGGEGWIGSEAAARLEKRLLSALAKWHDEEPMRPGMPRGALRGAAPENVPRPVVDAILARLEERGTLVADQDLVAAAGFVPRLTQRQEALAASVRADAMMAGLEPPTFREWADELDLTDEELRDVLAYLERDGSLTKAPGDFWFDKGAVDELRARVRSHLEAHGELPTPLYKDMIGTTRKFAVPLMELFDTEHLTVRRGEARVLRRKRSS